MDQCNCPKSIFSFPNLFALSFAAFTKLLDVTRHGYGANFVAKMISFFFASSPGYSLMNLPNSCSLRPSLPYESALSNRRTPLSTAKLKTRCNSSSIDSSYPQTNEFPQLQHPKPSSPISVKGCCCCSMDDKE